LEKDDIRFTRRIIETHSRKSIEQAANVTKTLGVKQATLARLQKYVGPDEHTDVADSQDWTPCRY